MKNGLLTSFKPAAAASARASSPAEPSLAGAQAAPAVSAPRCGLGPAPRGAHNEVNVIAMAARAVANRADPAKMRAERAKPCSAAPLLAGRPGRDQAQARAGSRPRRKGEGR